MRVSSRSSSRLYFYHLLIVITFVSIFTIGYSAEVLQVVSFTTETTSQKAIWIHDALEVMRTGKYSRIKVVSYWHEMWQNEECPPSDLRINSSEASLQAYRDGISDSLFISTPLWNKTNEGYKLVPSTEGIYHAAFPDFGGIESIVSAERIQEFEALAGKSITYAYFSDNWLDNISFPMESVEIIHSYGRIPYIRMMPWSVMWGDGADPVYSMQSIIDGEYDANLTRWAIAANSTRYPLIIEFGVEVNGAWFPWNGLWNGGGNCTEYGDPSYPDGPERFRDAYRHIIDLFRSNNIQNITWVFHVNDCGIPQETWNSMDLYYPGDEYIDWIGISVYGPQNCYCEWERFEDLMDQAYPKLCNISESKPLAVLEWAADENGGLGTTTTTTTTPSNTTTTTTTTTPSNTTTTTTSFLTTNTQIGVITIELVVLPIIIIMIASIAYIRYRR